MDLKREAYEVFNEGFRPIPIDQYRISSSGCLQTKKQDKIFIRLPLRGEASPTLVDQDRLNQVQLIPDKTSPLITLPVTRSNFRSGEAIKVRVNEPSRTRFCVEAEGQDRCTLKDGPRLAFESHAFEDFNGTIPLPDAEGVYRLSIVAEDRHGLSGLLVQNFTVDNTLPIVEVDFSQAESFLFDGRVHFYLDQGYRLGFRSKDEPLSQVKIEYCLLNSKSGESDSCHPEAIRVFGVENPDAVPSGAWTLLYRATDRSGNRTPGWDRLHILARTTCTDQEFLKTLEQAADVTCTELVGDLYVNRVAVENYARLNTLIGVSGKVSLAESDRKTLPSLANLRRLSKLEIRENYELIEIDMLPSLISVEDIDISENEAIIKLSGFHKLTTLRNLTIAFGEIQDIQAFGALTTIEGKLRLDYLPGLKNLSFLNAIQAIDTINLVDMENLSSLMALNSCLIKSVIEISHLPSLENLRGLEKARSLRKLWISNVGITSLGGLENLENVEDELTLYRNSELISLEDLRSLRLVNNLKIEKNGSLEEIDWQTPIEEIQTLNIEDNEVLRSVKGFDRLRGAIHSVRIEQNAELKQISGWSELTQLTSLTIRNNENLELIDFAAGLKQLTYSIDIQGNGKLQSILGFGNLNEQANLDILVKADLEASRNALSSYTTSPQDP